MFTFGSSFVYTEREGIKGGGLQATFQWNWVFVPNLLMFVRNKKNDAVLGPGRGQWQPVFVITNPL